MEFTFSDIIKKRSVKTALKLTIPLAFVFALWGCSFPRQKIYTSTIFSMDTVMELQVAGDKDYTPEAESYIRQLEKELSVTDPDSQIAKLNADGRGELSVEVTDILKGALNVCSRTNGALDITIYPVLKAWGFTTGDYRVPSDEELKSLLTSVDYRNVTVELSSEQGEKAGGTSLVTLEDGMMLDLGSVVKGYTGTAVAEKLKSLGVTHALLNLGGNVQCIGTKPNGDRWKVAIKSPFSDSTSGMLGVIKADDVAIITSGGYERFFEEDGKIYWHILDPDTGKPADNGLVSVTIVGKDGLLCDGLSTALFVKGPDEAVDIWRASNDFEAVFVTGDRQVYVTEGLIDDFELTSEYHDIALHVIDR